MTQRLKEAAELFLLIKRIYMRQLLQHEGIDGDFFISQTQLENI